ncbi:hypothetical protein HN903_00565 [archaeon]|nr:hypothetical protein [archaeon]MBT7128226.1 hypothetical protein [archaeon]
MTIDGKEFKKGGVYKLVSSNRPEYLNLVGVRKEVLSSDSVKYATFFSVLHDSSALINCDDFSAYKNIVPVRDLRIEDNGFLSSVNSWNAKHIWYDANMATRSDFMKSWLEECTDVLKKLGCENIEDIFRGKITWEKDSCAYGVFGSGSGKRL